MRAVIINSLFLFLLCAPAIKEIKTANLFGEIKFSSRDGFFDGKISIITDGKRMRMDLFSSFGRAEFVYFYSEGSCLFLFVGEKRGVYLKNNCEEIEIDGERIKIKELLEVALNRRESIKDVKVISYRFFEGVRFPSSFEMERDDWRLKIKLMDAKFNEEVEKMLTIDIPPDFNIEVRE